MPEQKSAGNARPVLSSPPLTDAIKRRAFLRLRNENYVASLRLKGMSVAEESTLMTLAELKRKYAR